MTDDWDSLRFFLAVARTASVGTAARRLHVSAVTVRRRIMSLETELGAKLFDRIDGVFSLTDQGKQLLPAAQQMELVVDRARETLYGADRHLAGRVRVGAPDAIAALCIAPALTRLRDRHPELVIELITLDQPADLDRREVDVAVVWNSPQTGPHRVRRLKAPTLHLYAARSYLAARPAPAKIEDLAGHSFVGYFDRSHFAEAVTARLKAAGVELTPMFSSNIIAQARAAAAGGGLALLPSYAVEPHLDLAPVLHEEVCVSFPLWLLVHAEMAQLARVKAVAAAIASAFQNGFESTPSR